METQKKYTKDNVNGVKFKCPAISNAEVDSYIYKINKLDEGEVVVEWWSSGQSAEIHYSMEVALVYLNDGTWTEIE